MCSTTPIASTCAQRRRADGHGRGPDAGASIEGAGGAAVATLLAPCDVQAIKACGVTFAVSLLERVIEEHAGGDASEALEIRATIDQLIARGSVQDRAGLRRRDAAEGGTRAARSVVAVMEVGIGPDAEVFSKSQPMSSVGFGADVGCTLLRNGTTPSPRSCRREQPRRDGRRDARQRRELVATSKATRRCCSARRRTTTDRARSAGSCGSSTAKFTLDTIRTGRAYHCASKARTTASNWTA